MNKYKEWKDPLYNDCLRKIEYRRRIKKALEKGNLENFINSFPPFDITTMDCILYLGGSINNINQLIDIQAKISGIDCIRHFDYDYIPQLGPNFIDRLYKEFGYTYNKVELDISLK